MVTIIQTVDFLSMRPLREGKNIGSFFSIESAYGQLGFYFVETCCAVVKF